MPTNISSSVQKNLVSNLYLHSHPYTFLAATNTQGSASIFNISKRMNEMENRISGLITIMKNREKEFFNLIGVKNLQDFNNRINAVFKEYPAIFALSSSEFVYFVNKGVDEKLNSLIDAYKIDDFKFNDKEDTIESFIVKNLINNPVFLDLSGRRSLGRIYSQKNGQITSKLTKEAERRVDLLLSQKGIKITNEALLKDLNITAENFIRSRGLEVTPRLKGFLKSAALAMKGKYTIQQTKDGNLSGLLGEYQTQVLFSIVLSNLKSSGNFEKIIYTGSDKDFKTGKQSSIDFLIGKFGIQTKNTLRNFNSLLGTDEAFHAINLIREVSINTFTDRLNSYNDELYKYLVQNYIYLKRAGLNKNGDFEGLEASQDGVTDIINFITSILADNSLTLFHSEADILLQDLQGKIQGIPNVGNLFFFVGGQSLVPVSYMIEGVLQQMKKDFQLIEGEAKAGAGQFNLTDEIGVSLGKIGTVKLEKGESQSVEYAQNLLREKRNALASLSEQDNKYNSYPDPLMEVGSRAGGAVRNSLKVRISFTYNLDQLFKMTNWGKLI